MRRWLIRDENGEPVGMWSILRDITEKKMRERELERVNAELRGYAHTVSHDLKNPLHEVSFSAHTLDMLMDRPDTEENRQYIADVLEIIKKGLDRANRLIDNVLTLAESGQVPHDVRPVDVAEKIDEVLEERSVEMEVRGIQVLKDSDMGVVMASPTHIYQLFSNLIKNAFEHCDSESPVIEVRGLGKANGEHRYLVRDNGSGIPVDLIDRIFIPFSHGSSGQTGIGLSIVDRITRVYAGDIKAYNDSGACFEFSLRDYQ
jgi:signal transduction histidine kinase